MSDVKEGGFSEEAAFEDYKRHLISCGKELEDAAIPHAQKHQKVGEQAGVPTVMSLSSEDVDTSRREFVQKLSIYLGILLSNPRLLERILVEAAGKQTEWLVGVNKITLEIGRKVVEAELVEIDVTKFAARAKTLGTLLNDVDAVLAGSGAVLRYAQDKQSVGLQKDEERAREELVRFIKPSDKAEVGTSLGRRKTDPK